MATADLVLPSASTGGFVAELLLDGQVLEWIELPEDRSPVTIQTAWAQGERDELCLTMNLFDPSHFVSSQHSLDCEPVPEELLTPSTKQEDCGCSQGPAPAGLAAFLGLLAIHRRRR